MAAGDFDVFVVGSADPSPASQARLASVLANRHGAPLATVAKAIAEKSLRAGHSLDRDEADALSRQLQGLGALTAIRRAAPASHSGPPPLLVRTNPGVGPESQRSLTPLEALPSVRSEPFGTPISSSALKPIRSEVFNSPRLSTPVVSTSVAVKPDAFSAPDTSADRPLELDTDMPGQGGPSGLEMQTGEEGHAFSVRCPQHGLLYDRRRARGCNKCQEPARTAARAIERDLPGAARLDGLRDNPARRAFIGLGLALFIGFLPAAYHALRGGTAEVRRLRAEQEELSRRVGTDENLRRFDELEDEVSGSRHRAMRNTLVLWVAVSGVALAGWYRIT